jgi:hypothetical protein
VGFGVGGSVEKPRRPTQPPPLPNPPPQGGRERTEFAARFVFNRVEIK